MPKQRTSLLVGLVAALVLVCLATFTLYARQRGTSPDACTCSGGGVTGGMAIVHCVCGPANCIAVRSNTATGMVSTSCVK